MDKFCFIVLHYNTFDETCQCVDSILELEDQEAVEIVLLDNASQNDSFTRLKARYQKTKVHLMQNKENIGFSRANNLALEYAKRMFSLEFVVFANNDVSFLQKDFVSRVRQEYQHSKFALLGPDVYTPRVDCHVSPITTEMVIPIKELKKRVWRGRVVLALFPLYWKFWKFKYSRGKIKEVIYDVKLEYQENVLLSGSCIICSEELLREKEKVFYPETYFYYEEYILAYWCHRHGKKIVFNPSIQILHFGGAATRSVSTEMKNKLKFRIKNDTESAAIYLKYREQNV